MDMKRLATSYMNHKLYYKMTRDELELAYNAILTEKKKRTSYNHDTSDYMFISALRQDEIIFKIKSTECRDISKYSISEHGVISNTDSPYVEVLDAIDIRPSGYPGIISNDGERWTYGELKWVYSEYSKKFDL